MFKFDSANEYAMLAKLDDLRRILGLPSRGHVVEMAVRHLALLATAVKNQMLGGDQQSQDGQKEGADAIPE